MAKLCEMEPVNILYDKWVPATTISGAVTITVPLCMHDKNLMKS